MHNHEQRELLVYNHEPTRNEKVCFTRKKSQVRTLHRAPSPVSCGLIFAEDRMMDHWEDMGLSWELSVMVWPAFVGRVAVASP
jgi:hypothetical protein